MVQWRQWLLVGCMVSKDVSVGYCKWCTTLNGGMQTSFCYSSLPEVNVETHGWRNRCRSFIDSISSYASINESSRYFCDSFITYLYLSNLDPCNMNSPRFSRLLLHDTLGWTAPNQDGTVHFLELGQGVVDRCMCPCKRENGIEDNGLTLL